MKKFLIIFLSLFWWQTHAQKHHKAYNRNRYYNQRVHSSVYEEGKGSFGMGVGMDYGGIGLRYTFIPEPHIAGFVGAGFAIAGFGANGGVMFRLQPMKKFVPTFSGMYGTNGAIYTTGVNGVTKLYIGPSAGVGLIMRSLKYQGRYLHFQLTMPFRTSDYDTDLIVAKASGAKLYFVPGNVLVSLGYHFSIE